MSKYDHTPRAFTKLKLHISVSFRKENWGFSGISRGYNIFKSVWGFSFNLFYELRIKTFFRAQM